MRTTPRISLLAVALLASTAAGQEEARIEDATLDAFPPPANAWADIAGAAVAMADEATLALTVELHALPEIQPGAAYCVVFSDGSSDSFGCLAATPSPGYLRGPWVDGGPGDTRDAEGSYSAGAPGAVTILFPVDDLAEGATEVSGIRAYALDIKNGAAPISVTGFLSLDEADGDATLALPASSTDRPANATAPPDVEEGATEAEEDAADPATPDEPARAATPGLGLLLLVGIVALVARLR